MGTDRLAKNPAVVCTELEDGAVLLNMETRLYYSLNEVGREVWRWLGTIADDEIASVLSQRYEVSREDAQDAVTNYLVKLKEEQLAARAKDGTPVDPTPSRAASDEKHPFTLPELARHDEPLHEVSMSPFDPQLPLAE